MPSSMAKNNPTKILWFFLLLLLGERGSKGREISTHIADSGFPSCSDSKEPACNVGDPGSILGQEDPLEKGMATHSSILAWRIPWTEEPGGLQSMESQRVGHD